MIIRPYNKLDIPKMDLHLKEGLQGFHYRQIKYSSRKIVGLLEGNVNNPGFFCHVIDVDGEIGGALAASIVEYMHSYEAYAQDHITYIREGYRSLKAITGLVTAYKAWATERGARQIRWGQSTGFKVEKFAVLAKRLGFEQIGTHWNMEVSQ